VFLGDAALDVCWAAAVAGDRDAGVVGAAGGGHAGAGYAVGGAGVAAAFGEGAAL